MNPLLDDWLDGQSTDVLKSKRRCLKFLKQAYAVCVGDFANKPRADVLMTDGGFRFHVGTPLPDLRHIASWMITRAPRQRTLARTIPALWKRHGREDVSVAGLLLANLDPAELGQDPWMAFIHLLQRKEPLLVVLEVAEELVRGGHSVPDDAWLRAAAGQSPHWHQYCVLFLSLRRTEVTCRDLVEQAPQGGEMFERIRSRLLQSES
ncbi:MAG: hypothetical protein QGI14_00815 [Candidatus Poseidonia sp.]|nr:hypothetical protein [Euryarchaeota archaeon]MDP7393715.1 hypothetical protein [Poseidonia sp.]MEC7059126.1 hypothetical protein [Candidatus Thermoplasmatota archaeon]MEC8766067.1 hypothetical protein [Candidatus Thermoplasmatota archaeon]